jgi:Uma2 family endonuclease
MAIEAAFRSEEVFTQAEFWEWVQRRPASDHNRYELVGGHIVMSPPAGWPHGGIEARLIGLLNAHVSQRKLGLILGSSAGYDLPSAIRSSRTCRSSPPRAWRPDPRPSAVASCRSCRTWSWRSSPTRPRSATAARSLRSTLDGVDEYWLVDARQREIAVISRAGDRFGPAVVISGGEIPSRVLPELGARFEDVFADPF